MIEVRIKNYEAISEAVIKIDGFTALVGENFLGKSSILRAINAALTNKQGTHFIKWGESFCEVHIKSKDIDILWHKEEGNNYYKVNGELFKKAGREDPPAPILDAGFRVIKLDKEKINLNYAKQFDNLFLVDRQDSRAADLIISLYGLDRLYKAISICNEQQREKSDIIRIRERDFEFLDKDLIKFQGFENTEKSVEGLKVTKKQIDTAEQQLLKVDKFIQEAQDLQRSCKNLKGIESLTILDGKSQKDLSQKLIKVTDLHSNLILTEKNIASIKSIEEIRPVEIVSNFQTLRDDHDQVTQYIIDVVDLSKDLKKLKGIDDIKTPVCSLDLEKKKKVEEWSMSFDLLNKEVAILLNELSEAGDAKKKIEKEKSVYSNCPVCGSKL